MIFLSKFGVKNQAKEFSFFNYFNSFFPRKLLGSGKNPYCWWKWMQTVFEVENLKGFLDTQSWMLLMHSYVALSTLVPGVFHVMISHMLTIVMNKTKHWHHYTHTHSCTHTNTYKKYLELHIVFCGAVHLLYSIFQVFLQVITTLLKHLISICQILHTKKKRKCPNFCLLHGGSWKYISQVSW